MPTVNTAVIAQCPECEDEVSVTISVEAVKLNAEQLQLYTQPTIVAPHQCGTPGHEISENFDEPVQEEGISDSEREAANDEIG